MAINKGAKRLVIKPKQIATGTVAMPPECCNEGNIKSNAAEPLIPTAALGERRIIKGINARANNSRNKSLSKATLPHVAL